MEISPREVAQSRVIESPTVTVTADAPQRATRVAQALVDSASRALEGKREVVELAVVALLARGHLLIEDVPGVGKTTLARALAKSLGLEFRRLQFTSDMMPADVVGGSVFDQARSAFVFRPGPIFTRVLLADEINRTTPKTQSALLEAMAENRVSIDGTTHELATPFFVLATQNPEEFFGTYPLPESQLDRFVLRIRIGYPEADVERALLSRQNDNDPVDALIAVATESELIEAQRAVDAVLLEPPVADYVHRVVAATRASSMLELGASTRALLSFARTVRARALVQGRTYATPDDVKALAVPALAHRVRVAGTRDGGGARSDAERVIREIASSIAVPV